MQQKLQEIREKELKAIDRRLTRWFRIHGRHELPWRQERSLWATIVSEIMLQQTQIVTVLPYFANFMERWPTPQAMSAAGEQAVLKAWEGLGYYRRASLLYRLAQAMPAHAPSAPPPERDLRKLPGIGLYTAKAILAFYYNQEKLPVDGNLCRVFARCFTLPLDPGKETDRRRLAEWVEPLIPRGHGRVLGEALMDLGATCCHKQQPRCPSCPLQDLCAAYRTNSVKRYPLTVKSVEKAKEQRIYLLFYDDTHLALRRRPSGLLAKTYEYYLLQKLTVKQAPPQSTAAEIDRLLQAEFRTEELAVMETPQRLLRKTGQSFSLSLHDCLPISIRLVHRKPGASGVTFKLLAL